MSRGKNVSLYKRMKEEDRVFEKRGGGKADDEERAVECVSVFIFIM